MEKFTSFTVLKPSSYCAVRAVVKAAARAAMKVGLWDDEILVPIGWPVAIKVSAAPENEEVEL